MAERDDERWNHNIHYHPRVIEAVPAGAQRALDVGCGEGMLARELRRVAAQVTGIDLDEPSVEAARLRSDDVDYVLGDFLTHPFEPASFDFIASVATLHHVEADAGLARMRDLLRPGGVLAVVGLARSSTPRDVPLDLAGTAASAVYRATRGHWEHPSPTVWPPPATYRQMRELSAALLPGSRFRRHLLLRYSIVWQKPQRS